MHSVKLTVLIEDRADIDMEVRVLAQEASHEAAITPLKPRVVASRRDTVDDEYTLGGYAGI
jgi:hypothetical protein